MFRWYINVKTKILSWKWKEIERNDQISLSIILSLKSNVQLKDTVQFGIKPEKRNNPITVNKKDCDELFSYWNKYYVTKIIISTVYGINVMKMNTEKRKMYLFVEDEEYTMKHNKMKQIKIIWNRLTTKDNERRRRKV